MKRDGPLDAASHSLKYMPRLSFREDRVEEYKRNIGTILDKIETERRGSGAGLDGEEGAEDEQ